MHACAQVSAGRLGVITALTLRIVPNAMVRRATTDTSVDQFLAILKAAQAGWNAEGLASPAGAPVRLYMLSLRMDRLCA